MDLAYLFEVIAKLEPQYVRLSNDLLQEKCLHGKVQNQNESLNGMIWQRVPKEVYVGRETLELGLYDAVAHFNIGAVTVIRILQALNIPPGKYTEEGCKLLDQLRVDGAEYKSKASTKKRRKVIRGLKKKKRGQKQTKRGCELCLRTVLESCLCGNSVTVIANSISQTLNHFFS